MKIIDQFIYKTKSFENEQEQIVNDVRVSRMASIKSIEELLEPTRNSVNLTDTQLRQISINAIADDFLKVQEVGLEERYYLVKTTLPSLVVSLEKLLKEMMRRNIHLESAKDEQDIPPAAESDVPKPNFDSINWLGNLFNSSSRFISN